MRSKTELANGRFVFSKPLLTYSTVVKSGSLAVTASLSSSTRSSAFSFSAGATFLLNRCFQLFKHLLQLSNVSAVTGGAP